MSKENSIDLLKFFLKEMFQFNANMTPTEILAVATGAETINQ